MSEYIVHVSLAFIAMVGLATFLYAHKSLDTQIEKKSFKNHGHE